MKIKTLSVSEVNNYIKKILDNDFILNNLSVKGEISNLKYHSSGHIYFSLKDDNGKINCVMFKSRVFELTFDLKEGMEVIVTGKASVYSSNGTFQIYCEEIQKQGLGELYIKFEQLKTKLASKGYFDEKSKKYLPSSIERIGIVTSPTGAAIQDLINVIRRRNKLVDIVLYPAQVQGNYAYKTIISGINYFNKNKNVDVIIIGRGGGSIEELWNFNEEELATCIFKSKLPIISAVGHEVDFTISDFVSDIRAATPSQAGEIVTAMDEDIFNKLNQYNLILNRIIQNRLSIETNKLDNNKRILALNSPINRIVNGYIEVQNIKEKLDSKLSNMINVEKSNIVAKNNILLANNPINILGKGYAIIKGVEDNYLKDMDDFKDKEDLKIVLRDGYVKGNFTLVEKGGDLNGKEGNV